MAQILIISDGKAGHRNQSLGLAEALLRLKGGEVHEIAPLSPAHSLSAMISGRSLELPAEKPALLIGAGHATHLTLLAAKRVYRVPAVVLMKPTLPISCFDLCLVPEHDSPPIKRNVVPTSGALNRMRPGEKAQGSGMMLIGGPSKSNAWDEEGLIEQLRSIISGSRDIQWRLTTSRRTPNTTLDMLRTLNGVDVVPVEETGEGWLPKQLSTTEFCWVSEDSVSMIYEALTAGCAVGTLNVPWVRQGRLLRGIDLLASRGVIRRFQPEAPVELIKPNAVFDEASRCAELILDRGWL